MTERALLPAALGITALLTLGLAGQPGAEKKAAGGKLPTANELLDRMAGQFGPDLPPDVDTALKSELEKDKRFAEVQLQFDILSWQTFAGVSWPTGGGDKQERVFDTWKTDDDTFPADGGRPKPWGQDVRAHTRMAARGAKVPVGARALAHLSSIGRVGLEAPRPPGPVVTRTEVPQAFSNPVWDQNGFMVRYEILLNRDEFEYVVENGLYNVEGQIAFAAAGKKVCFPYGVFPGDAGPPVGLGPDCSPRTKSPGAIELKLAWKVLKEPVYKDGELVTPGDLAERFVTATAKIYSVVDSSYSGPVQQTFERDVRVGLVGMHIAHKTKSSPQWVWSTFAHVDNLQTNDLERVNGRAVPTLFNNPSRPYAPVNTPAQTQEPFSDGQPPTQVTQLVPTPKATQEVNRRAQLALRASRDPRVSVLQYYELLGTQWPTQPGAPPTPGGPGTAPGSIANKSGGVPTPTFLINPIMETYFQKGNQPAGGQEEGRVTDATPVFGTESCMGCHSSATAAFGRTAGSPPRAVGGPPLSGDFSWLLAQRARFKAAAPAAR